MLSAAPRACASWVDKTTLSHPSERPKHLTLDHCSNFCKFLAKAGSPCSHFSVSRQFWNKARYLKKIQFSATFPDFFFHECLPEELFTCACLPSTLKQNETVGRKLFNHALLLRKNKVVCFFTWRERTEKGVNIFCLCCNCFWWLEVLLNIRTFDHVHASKQGPWASILHDTDHPWIRSS